MEHGHQLLYNSELSVIEIGFQSGYDSTSQFKEEKAVCPEDHPGKGNRDILNCVVDADQPSSVLTPTSNKYKTIDISATADGMIT
jgi:hypothetical protein